jgi:hypothetical protein
MPAIGMLAGRRAGSREAPAPACRGAFTGGCIMKSRHTSRSAVLSAVLTGLALLAWLSQLAGAATPGLPPPGTGFYLVLADGPTAQALPAPTADQQVVRYDYKYLQETERGAVRYLLLPRRASVPLDLAAAPALQEKGANGFPEIRLELTRESARALESLTREHLGQQVAFVIEGEPVTLHRIRSVITGGQFRLSRCTDHACQYLYGQLTSR